jgi:hypothetical protein
VQLRVALGDQATRHIKVSGQRARRRNAVAGPEPTGTDSFPQRTLELVAQGFWPRAVDRDEQLRT